MSWTVLRSIRFLKSRWNHLDIFTKADLICDVVRHGVSRRTLAKEIGCSESLVRHVAKASELPEELKAGIRLGQISARAAITRPAVATATSSPLGVIDVVPGPETTLVPVPQRPVSNVTPTPLDAKGWAELMVNFALNKYSPQRDACAQVVREARILCQEAPYLRLGASTIPFGASLPNVIEHSRPLRHTDDFTDISRWLAVWVQRLIPDKKVQAKAFAIAEDALLLPIRN